ncbi:MAG: septin family protein [Gammaproteobacteria bacterium]|nr:septin family protein [Gammaproteobacteria bacterium]MCW8987381.1 septin family protein [Gammaproteobacteria bacterium]
MKKSIYMFIGGSLFGLIAAVIIVKSSSHTEQNTPKITSTTSAKIVTAKMQAEQMQNSDAPMESMSDMQVRLSQQPGTQGMLEMEANAQSPESTEDIPQTNLTTTTQSQPQQKSVMAAPAIPPTAEQVQQYHDIDNVIMSAANNPQVKLVDLIRKADTLTIQQRNQLTQKTMGMLDRGELNIEQFANNQK